MRARTVVSRPPSWTLSTEQAMQRNMSNVYSPQFALQPINPSSRHNSEETARKDAPPPLPAQQSHDKADAKARRQAAKDLTQSWMDRLQLISVITTFFASTEAGMLQVTTPGGTESSTVPIIQITNAAFIGALVLHIWAAIISFMAAFFLVRYNLKEAKEEELHTRVTSDREPVPASQLARPGTDESLAGLLIRPLNVWTANPHLEQVGPFQLKPPTHLLSRCHNLCILLTFVGFGLTLLGIVTFAWGQNPVSVGVVTSVATAFCFASAVWVFLH